MGKFFSKKPSMAEADLFRGKDILTSYQFTKEELEIIMHTAAYYEEALLEKRRLYDMDGKIMASLFFEPSTRTRLSFETAMNRLGGSCITVAESVDAHTSSLAKGESIYDSMRVIDTYADVIVCRSPEKGTLKIAAEAAEVPVINAGDGPGQHPTQALLDIYTIFKEKEDLDGLTIALVGDLKHGRTVHSLVDFLAMYHTKLIFCSPSSLPMPEIITQKVRERGVEIEESNNLADACSKADVIYMTRVQRERFEDVSDYEAVKDEFIIDEKMVDNFKEGAIILHPLPRVNEITVGVDQYPGAAYFRQVGNGVPVRMALLALVTGSVK